LPVETYNAEISLLTGMCAATLMLHADYGILRTVRARSGSNRGAGAGSRPLSVSTGRTEHIPVTLLSPLDRKDPKHVAFLDHGRLVAARSSYAVRRGGAESAAAFGRRRGIRACDRAATAALSIATAAKSVWPQAPSSRCRVGA